MRILGFLCLTVTITLSAAVTCPQSTLEAAKTSEAPLTAFAINFYKELSTKNADKNVVYSPVSIALGLALLEAGAAGETKEKITQQLIKSGSNTDVSSTYVALQQQLNIEDQNTKLTIANGAFPQKDFALKQDFSSTVKECYKGEALGVDFKEGLEPSRQKINGWISNKTYGKIPELFKTGVLTPRTVLVLANAVYFKAAWKTAFYERNTVQDTFCKFGREDDNQTVKFMVETGAYGYSSTSDVEVLELGYKNQEVAFYIVLPKAKNGLNALEKSLTPDNFKTLISGVRDKQLKVMIPKFKIRLAVDLEEGLKKLGLGVIFSDAADFSRLTDTKVKVTAAVHEAFINVNENGTEAAAATGFAVSGRSMSRPSQMFMACHPFLYAVVHKPTNAVLFLGKVNYIEDEQ